MEQSIIDFANQQELFCNEFRRSLEAEVEKRHRDLSGLSSNLGKMLEKQLQVTLEYSFIRLIKYFPFMSNFPDGGKTVQLSDGPTLCGTKVGDELFEDREKRGGQGIDNNAEVPNRECPYSSAASGHKPSGPDQDSGHTAPKHQHSFLRLSQRQTGVHQQPAEDDADSEQQSEGIQSTPGSGTPGHR